MTWMCPKCKGMDLKVDIVIHTRARLIQEADGNFQTDEDGGDHEWDEDGLMECCDCGHEAKVSAFRVPDDYPAMLKLTQQLARMNYDGEEINPGHGEIEEFVMENDDAVSTLSGVIREAREVLGEE